MAKILINLVSALFFIDCVYSAKILGVFQGASYSHQHLGNTLLFELAARGHEITSIAPEGLIPKKLPENFKTVPIQVNPIKKIMVNVFNDYTSKSSIRKMLNMDIFGLSLTELSLNQTSVAELLKSDEKFDLVIMENLLNGAFRGFCYHFKAPCVIISTIGSSSWTNPQMGNPHFPSYVPEMYLNYPSNMNFFQRLHNTIMWACGVLYIHFYSFPKQNELLQKYFPNAPHLSELYYNSSLMLLNSHVSVNPAMPYVPNMIDIGGYHVHPPKPLPKDLKDYIDQAKNGVIYFSMGSHIDPKIISEEKLNAIIKVFSKLKQNVLWKWSDKNLPNTSKNIKISKWFPQQDVLAHPNVILFISHGGLLSTIETIYHGKPIVGIPMLADQEMNVATAELNGFAKALQLTDLTEETFENALNEVLNNPKYAENARRRSKVMHDEPMKPLDKAMFWIEYVLRHKGAEHLKTNSLNLYWYQLISLDIIVFILGLILMVLYTFSKVCKIIFQFICKNEKTDKSKKIN